MNSHNKDEWIKSMKTEIASLNDNKTWVLVPRPSNTNIVGSKWTYKIKRDVNNKVTKYKSRLVAVGCSQKPGIDYQETFSPVARWETIRLMVSHALHNDLPITQMDIASAYLYGKIDAELYMKQPVGFTVEGNLVCKLLRSIYGLKQSGVIWHNLLKQTILQCGTYHQSTVDPCLFYADQTNLILIYVDDILFIGKNTEMKLKIQQNFTTHDLGPISQFLNVRFTRTQDTIIISQPKFIHNLLETTNLLECNPKQLPDRKDEGEGNQLPNNTGYIQLIGSIIYLTTVSRPDIAFAVTYLARQSAKPTTHHWVQLKHLLAFLKGTIHKGIKFQKSINPALNAFCDSDYAGDANSGRSTSGILIFHGKNVVSWKSSLQSRIALSSFEAEYYALTDVTKEIMYHKQLLEESNIKNEIPTTIRIDNQSAIAVANSPIEKYNSKTKHINTKHHFIKKEIQEGQIILKHVPSIDNVADALTKVLPRPAFLKLTSYLTGG